MDLEKLGTFRVAACDLNGQMRGKRLPSDYASKLSNGGVRMPLSALVLDIWGEDSLNSPLVFESGDGDGSMVPTERGAVPMPWLQTPSALVPMWMFTDNGSAFEADPRHALARVLDRFANKGWQVIAATEMEFYLVDDSNGQLRAPINPLSGRPLHSNAVLSVSQLDAFDGFFTELYAACELMGIAVQSATSEVGLGQFEVSLNHCDAMRAADDAWLFKILVKGLARKHQMAATFMAKPYLEEAGNGLHVHFSVIDEDGKNIFDDGSESGSDLLHQAVAGCLAAMTASTLVFAPHSNSYQRITPGAHAPTGVCWAYENRTAALRIPGGPPAARRIEHRVACGDINPYLMLSVVLGAALAGIEDGLSPPTPITGNAYDQDMPQLATDWTTAMSLFESDPMIARILPGALIENFCITKQQEYDKLQTVPEEEHWKVYLETV